MIREDLENLNYSELSDTEKQEYVAVLLYNSKRLCLQLVNSGDNQLAGIISIATGLAMSHPNRLNELAAYALKMHQISMLDLEMQRRTNEIAAAQEEKKKEQEDEFPALDTEIVS